MSQRWTVCGSPIRVRPNPPDHDERRLTPAECSVIVALSQRLHSLAKLAELLDCTPKTIDRLIGRRTRRTRPSTIARVRAALVRAVGTTVHSAPGVH